jgi:flagellar hook assembly protein FlgD
VVAQLNAGTRGVNTGSVNISSTITAEATVQVNITHNGKPIRTVDNSTRAAGPLAVVWDEKDSSGHAVPADIYNVEVKAVDSAGHTVRQIVPLILPGR